MEIKSESANSEKTNHEFWLNHIKEWECSNLSQGAYCKKVGIKYSTFVYWRGHFLMESGQSKSQQFAPVKIKQRDSGLSESIKLKLATGGIVCIPVSVGLSEIAKLIKLLEQANA